jgi:hypothetical protein
MYGERTFADMKRMCPMIDQIYFERHPDNPRLIRTYTPRLNRMSGTIPIPSPTNWHEAEPTPEMKAWSPAISRALTMQNLQPMFY